MNNNQDSSQQINTGAAKSGRTRNIWIIVSGLLVLAIIICLAYFAGVSTKPQANVPPQTTAAPSVPSTPTAPPAAVSTPANTTPSTPAYAPPPSPPMPPSTPAPQPAPAPQPPAVTPSVSGTLITRQAYQMVLTLNDMGTGWIFGNAASAPKSKALSTSHVTYSGGSAFSPVVQNTTTVYRTVEAAVVAYDSEKPSSVANLTLSYPGIGDECILNSSVLTNKSLIFRKNNVVASIQIQQDKSGDPEHYARIVEQKIVP